MKKFIALTFLSAFLVAFSAPTFAAVGGSEIVVLNKGGDDKKKKKKEKSDCEPQACYKVTADKG
jgi:hypothetical protein